MGKRIGAIHPPERTEVIPKAAQWLSGQGKGAWFYIERTTSINQYRIQRFAATGSLDCDGIFELEKNDSLFNIEKDR